MRMIQKLIGRWGTRTWRDVSSYMITYLPLNYDMRVLPEYFLSNYGCGFTKSAFLAYPVSVSRAYNACALKAINCWICKVIERPLKKHHFCCILNSLFSYVVNSLHFNLADFPLNRYSRVFNFAVLLKSRKSDAREEYVSYSISSLSSSSSRSSNLLQKCGPCKRENNTEQSKQQLAQKHITQHL